jgi:hypothetical protein
LIIRDFVGVAIGALTAPGGCGVHRRSRRMIDSPCVPSALRCPLGALVAKPQQLDVDTEIG